MLKGLLHERERVGASGDRDRNEGTASGFLHLRPTCACHAFDARRDDHPGLSVRDAVGGIFVSNTFSCRMVAAIPSATTNRFDRIVKSRCSGVTAGPSNVTKGPDELGEAQAAE